jgi:hypothetical protein
VEEEQVDHAVDNGSDPVRDEIVAALLSEETSLSDIWRRTQEGDTPEQLKEAYGTQRTTFVWNYMRTAKAIVDGDLPTAPTVALAASRTLRRFLKDHDLSPESTAVLRDRLEVLESRAVDPHARKVEDEQARTATAQAEERAEPGIYVYTLPHYIRHPYDEESGRTLLKVGRTDRDMIRRFREQIRTTALPEDPVLLRVYPCQQGESVVLEAKFHGLLEAASHDRSTARTGGTEWFLTSTRFLDKVAETLGLKVRDVSDLGEAVSDLTEL